MQSPPLEAKEKIDFNFCPMDGRPFTKEEKVCPLCYTDRNIFEFVKHLKLLAKKGELKPKWRKLLYIKQPDYPDNYVDHSFLDELKKNANVKQYRYWQVVKSSTVFTQHFSTILIFYSIFMQMYHQELQASALISLSFLFSFLAFAIWDFYMKPNRMMILKGSILIVLTLSGLTPILKTLTQDTSDDTIWFMTALCFLVHLLFHDYSQSLIFTIPFPASLSLNAAIFASVILASRLKSQIEVFGILLFSLKWFALFPIWRRFIKVISTRWHIELTIFLFLISVWQIGKLAEAPLIALYILFQFLITFLCPFWLIWIQKYKSELSGPWDEAKLSLNNNKTT